MSLIQYRWWYFVLTNIYITWQKEKRRPWHYYFRPLIKTTCRYFEGKFYMNGRTNAKVVSGIHGWVCLRDCMVVWHFLKSFHKNYTGNTNLILRDHLVYIMLSGLEFTIPELQIRCVKLTAIDSTYIISSPNAMFDCLLESSRWDDSSKWLNKELEENIEFGQEIGK